MKARFSRPQQRVKTITSGEKIYIFLCLNETQGAESYPDMGDGATTESYYEYDYNEIIGKETELPLEDIQVHPENYLTYEAPRKKTIEERLSELEYASDAINKALLS